MVKNTGKLSSNHFAAASSAWIAVIPKSTHIERKKDNFNVFDFEFSDEDMSVIAKLNKKQRSFFSHTEPNMVERFVKMVEERKENNG